MTILIRTFQNEIVKKIQIGFKLLALVNEAFGFYTIPINPDSDDKLNTLKRLIE